jgi:hypothetical protein
MINSMNTLPNMISYYNEQIRISINVPEEWTGQIISNSQFRLFGLPEVGFEKYFEEYRPTMSYMLAVPENNKFNWFESLIIDSSQEMVRDYNEYQLINEEWCEISDQKAYFRHYEWREETTQLQFSQLQSIIYASPNSFYLVNASVLKPIASQYIPIFDAILKSTRIIPS